MRHGWTGSLGAIVTVLLLGGCSTPPRVEVAEQWSDAMARLDMLGLYPMSEDVQIGDVFLIAPRAASADRRTTPRFRTVRMGHAPADEIRNMLMRQEEGRIRVRWTAPAAGPVSPPVSPGSSATASVTGIGTATVSVRQPPPAPRPNPPTGGQRGGTPGTGQQRLPEPLMVREVGNTDAGAARLRRIAVPGLVAASVSRWQAGAAGPLADIAGAIGLGGSAEAAVTIRLRSLATLAVDEPIALQSLDRRRAEWVSSFLSPYQLVRHLQRLDERAAIELCRGDTRAVRRRELVIAVANAVVYAGRIEYEFGRSTTAALLGGANLSAVLAQVQPAAVPVVPAAVPGAATGAPDPGALAAQLRATQDALAQSLPTSAGARTSVGLGSYGGLTLTEDFATPVAVGIGAPVYYAVENSLIAAGRTENEADSALDRGLRACALLLGVEWEPSHTPRNPPEDLEDVRNLICRNSVLDQRREAVFNPGGAVPALPGACRPDEPGEQRAAQPRPAVRTPAPTSTTIPRAEFLRSR